MKNDVISINKSMLIKAFIISFILLTVVFTAGIILGKADRALRDRTSADSSDVQEQLSDCSYKLQEITTRHLDLVDIAKKKGLVDSEGRYYPEVVCSAMEETVDDDKTTDESEVPDETDGKLENKPESEKKTEPEKKNVPEKKIEPEKASEEPAKAETKEAKASEPKKEAINVSNVSKDCLYSIQLFAGTSKEQALTAQKKYKISNTRLVEGIVKGKSWYRIRYGCFSTKDEAEKFLPGIKDKIEGAIVVAE